MQEMKAGQLAAQAFTAGFDALLCYHHAADIIFSW
jgi:hypothetical protein